MEPLMNLQQTSEYLGFNKRHLYRIINIDPTFPAHKITGEWRIDPAELKQWVKDQPTRPVRQNDDIRPRRGRPPLHLTVSR